MLSILWRFALLLSLGQFAEAEVPMADPTRPPPNLTTKEEGKTEAEPISVSLIVIGPAGRHAVINGVEVKVGGSVGGYEVLAIHPRQVVLRRNGVEKIADILTSHKITR